MARLPNGAPLALRREPNNPADPLAIEVWANSDDGPVHIGFLKASQGHALAQRMDRDAALSARLSSGVSEVKLAIDGGKWPLVEVEEG